MSSELQSDVRYLGWGWRHLVNVSGKEEYLIRLLYTMYISKRSGMDHIVLPANTPCLPFLRKR